MKLISECNYPEFLSAVQRCHGDVWFVTTEGDRLNMKSTLCSLIFLSSIVGHPAVSSGELIASNPGDLEILGDFLQSDSFPQSGK